MTLQHLVTIPSQSIPIHPISLAISWSLRGIRMPPWTTTSTWTAPPDRRLRVRVALIPPSTAPTLGEKKTLGGTPSVEHGYGKLSVYTGWKMFFFLVFSFNNTYIYIYIFIYLFNHISEKMLFLIADGFRILFIPMEPQPRFTHTYIQAFKGQV